MKTFEIFVVSHLSTYSFPLFFSYVAKISVPLMPKPQSFLRYGIGDDSQKAEW